MWESLDRSGVLDFASEAVIVGDGSTDTTRKVLAQLAKGPRGSQLRVVGLSSSFFGVLCSARVTAPSDADETSAAYFAITPRA